MNPQADTVERALGERIRVLRDFRGWTQEDLALHSGLDRGDLVEIELGIQYPTVEHLGLIARCLGVTASELLAGIERL